MTRERADVEADRLTNELENTDSDRGLKRIIAKILIAILRRMA